MLCLLKCGLKLEAKLRYLDTNDSFMRQLRPRRTDWRRPLNNGLHDASGRNTNYSKDAEGNN
jgi:hypothetical protein